MTADQSAFWPEHELESQQVCPACGGYAKCILYDGLLDVTFGAAPGHWSLQTCGTCHSAYLDPRPTASSIWKAYSRYYTHQPQGDGERGWTRRFVRAISNGYLNRRYGLSRTPALSWGSWLSRALPPLRGFLDATMRHLPRHADGGRLLDVGCGHGAFLTLAREAGWGAKGVDLDPIAIATARQQGLDVVCGGIDVLNDDEASYDYVTLSHVIEHVHDPLTLMRKILFKLRPGGQIWIETPNIAATGHARFGSAWRGLEVPRHLVIFSAPALVALLKQAGFVKVRRLYRGAVAPMTYAESEAIAANLPLMGAGLASRRKWRLLKDCLIQECLPQRREFITLLAERAV